MLTGEIVIHRFKNVCRSLERSTINKLIDNKDNVEKFSNLDSEEKNLLVTTIKNFSKLCKKLNIN